MDARLERSRELKQALWDFVLDAEGETATALEAYSADQMAKWSKTQLQGISRNDLVIDMFSTEGQVGDQTPLNLFIQSYPDLSEADKALVESWQRSFNGLFTVLSVDSEEFELMNWLTEKQYRVRPNGLQAPEKLVRLKPGEIVQTRISPLDESSWIFSGPIQLLGKLGKPKLAVAIGTFKDQFNQHLYGDAPDLMEEAWLSVERYHQEFIDFFEGDEITLSGYELDKKLAEFQEIATQRRLEAAGVDSNKTLSEMAAEAGVSEAEIAESAAELGADEAVTKQLLDGQKTLKMVMPKTALPDPLRRAEQVTVLVHPRWGQSFLTDYGRLTQLLSEGSEEAAETLDKLLLKYLKEGAINAYVWYRLAHEFPGPLEPALQRALARPTFNLKADLDDLLRTFEKPLKPGLPEIASVPLHLHNLFQEALVEVGESKGKSKAKSKSKRVGFG
ncbi:hypothetical protein [Pseudanabaena sp. FACHB-2040]|uniref:hypothetical protein n=1 Tax=Pseudanabaena sp. FACHB-2040 TaxID=2692859 RepID=UPI001686DED1|nr:hypothetical protein [Pseudanabaena sp. FACHB-2040]